MKYRQAQRIVREYDKITAEIGQHAEEQAKLGTSLGGYGVATEKVRESVVANELYVKQVVDAKAVVAARHEEELRILRDKHAHDMAVMDDEIASRQKGLDEWRRVYDGRATGHIEIEQKLRQLGVMMTSLEKRRAKEYDKHIEVARKMCDEIGAREKAREADEAERAQLRKHVIAQQEAKAKERMEHPVLPKPSPEKLNLTKILSEPRPSTNRRGRS